MPSQVTLVARAERDGPWIARLLRCLDDQTVGYDAFSLVFEVEDDTPLQRRLRELAERRPNIEVRTHGSPGAGDRSGWVVDLGDELDIARPRLLPDALARIVALADSGAYDVLVGRVLATRARLVNDVFVGRTDWPADLDPAALELGVVVRRDGGAGGRVGVLGPAPVLQTSGQERSTATTEVSTAHASWDGPILRLSASGTCEPPPADAGVVFSLRHGDGREIWLPTASSDVDGDRFTGTTDLDVAALCRGGEVGGIWRVEVGVHGAAPTITTRAPLPPQQLAPALIDGTHVLPVAVDSVLALDLGGTRGSAVSTVAPGDVTIAEDARGAAMTARLAGIHVVGDFRERGTILLGDFSLPADLIGHEGQARVECYLSSLAGRAPLSTQFADAPSVDTGLVLVTSPVGAFSVEPAPPPSRGAAPVQGKRPGRGPGAPAPATSRVHRDQEPASPRPANRPATRPANRPAARPAARPSARPSGPPRRAPVLVRLRRRTPDALEPLVGRLSRSRLGRRAASALWGRTGRQA